jgi:hypothetical protein
VPLDLAREPGGVLEGEAAVDTVHRGGAVQEGKVGVAALIASTTSIARRILAFADPP